ncbi:MAG: SLC13/DASS family transporter [Candidatus Dadabacteria bacterium]|nr:SLC13/DASS family transporter [Candidatus Dadabacteria bacterium]MYC40711.1 SLC13/DASS family transporter [Candidatus Dadabacteria bacterium]
MCGKKQFPTSGLSLFFLIMGPVLGAVLFFTLKSLGWESDACWTAAVSAVCAVWWIFEPVPIPVTSLLPFALFPILGVLSPREISESYGAPLILLLLGGFILSTAMAGSGAHRRIALTMVSFFGGSSNRRLVFGFMAASAVLSMWISNTATTLMMLPVAIAVLEKAKDKTLAVPLLLGIAHAASVGGIGTPIGTPPNLVFSEIYFQNTGAEIPFLTWMSWGIPVVVIFVPIIGFYLTRHLSGSGSFTMPEVGKWSAHEMRVLIVFLLTAVAWMTRSEPFGGWKTWFGVPGATDASVALAAVIVMFLVPNGKGGRLLDWDTASDIPWGMLILFGGGIAIAKAFISSGLSIALGEALSGLGVLHIVLILAIICLTITFLTELTSNTATTTLMMPILAATAMAMDIEPALLMVPAAMSASCAFMLPVATAPNVVVFSTGAFPARVMARKGVVLNFIGAFIITAVCAVLL